MADYHQDRAKLDEPVFKTEVQGVWAPLLCKCGQPAHVIYGDCCEDCYAERQPSRNSDYTDAMSTRRQQFHGSGDIHSGPDRHWKGTKHV
jgi:hypothetical protein